MSTINTAAKALYGAYRLARLDPGGIKYFDDSPNGFWHSFTAVIVVFPMFLGTMIARWSSLPDTVSGWRYIFIEFIAYAIAWTAYPVLMAIVVKAIDRERFYIRGIIAYNWAGVLQNMLYMPVAILGLAGIGGTEPLAMFILLAVIFYSWFVAKTTLELSPMMAWGIVGLDVLISVILSSWTDTLIKA